MHLRISTKRQNGRTYRYTQLVQSCRVAGKSTQRVLANLGDLPERTLDNLKVALQASRECYVAVPEAEFVADGLAQRVREEGELSVPFRRPPIW